MSEETLLSLHDTCLGNLKGRGIMFGWISQLQLATSSRKDWKLNTRDAAVKITPLIPVSAHIHLICYKRMHVVFIFRKQSAAVGEKWLNETRHISRVPDLHLTMEHCLAPKLTYLASNTKGYMKEGRLKIYLQVQFGNFGYYAGFESFSLRGAWGGEEEEEEGRRKSEDKGFWEEIIKSAVVLHTQCGPKDLGLIF